MGAGVPQGPFEGGLLREGRQSGPGWYLLIHLFPTGLKMKQQPREVEEQLVQGRTGRGLRFTGPVTAAFSQMGGIYTKSGGGRHKAVNANIST